MNLKEILNNSSENKSTISAFFKKYRILIGMCLVCLVILSILLIAHNKRNNKSLEMDYQGKLDLYNKAVQAYNHEIDKLTALHDEFSFPISNGIPEKKIIIEMDFDSYYESGADISLLTQNANNIDIEKEELILLYNTACVNGYNNKLDYYNESVEKYNELGEKLNNYGIGFVSEETEKVEKVSLQNVDLLKRWDNIQDFKVDYVELESKIESIGQKYYEACLNSYNTVVEDYNIVAREYNSLMKTTSIDFVSGMHKFWQPKNETDIESIKSMSEQELCIFIEKIMDETESLAADYVVALQITNPEKNWVMDRLKGVEDITKIEAVTNLHDPNELLDKEGGYTACIYFNVKSIDPKTVKGNTVVDKGTDAGGAIEIYESKEYALNRCDYLSQFDGTLLYSGSYAVIGTMVIRTSYKLSNEQQIELTNKITAELTTIK